MTNTERMHKVLKSLDRSPYKSMALLIPFRIAHRCILRAKTAEAKKRLVQTSIWISVADTRRIWRGGNFDFPTPKKLVPKKGNAFVNFLKNLI